MPGKIHEGIHPVCKPRRDEYRRHVGGNARKFVGHGFIREFADIFRLDRYRDEIVEMDGFGEKSYQNLIDSIERAKNTTLPRLIFGLGILNIGLANARMICKAFNFDLDRIRNASAENFAQIDGVGEVIAKVSWITLRMRKIKNALSAFCRI